MTSHEIWWRCAVHGRIDDPVLFCDAAYCPACMEVVKLAESPALAPKQPRRAFAYHAAEFAKTNAKTHRRVTCVSALAIHCARCSALIPPQTEFVGIAEGTRREDVCRRCAGG